MGNMIKITLEIRSGLKEYVQTEVLDISIQNGSSFVDLANWLSKTYGDALADVLFSKKYGFLWLCVKNRKRVLPEEILEEGDRVMLLPPLAGG